MKKLNFLGIGPKIAIVLLPWLGSSIFLSYIRRGLFRYTPGSSDLLLISGIVLLTAGLVFYFSTIRLLLKGLKEPRLVTEGTYSLCQNPLYASLIIFIIPALSLVLNSWLILTTSVVGYLLVKIFIKSEYHELEDLFGDAYLKYKKETPEFFPLPLKKWTKQK